MDRPEVDRPEDAGAEADGPDQSPQAADAGPRAGPATPAAVPHQAVARRSPTALVLLRRMARSRRWRRALLVTAALGLVAGMAAHELWTTMVSDPEDDGVVDLVVVPLEAADSADVPWVDGLTEQLIETLAGAPGVSVRVRSVAFALRDVPPTEAVTRTDADLVLSGLARRDPERVRIGLELSDPEGRTLWADSYEHPVEDVVRIRTWRQIAQAVLAQLRPELGEGGPTTRFAAGEEADSIPDFGGRTDDLTAREYYDRGRWLWLSRSPGDFLRSIQYYSMALERDPAYARAWAGLADAYNLMGSYDYGLLHPDSAYPRARQAALNALQNAPRLPDAWAALAHTRYVYDWDWEGADAAYRRALELNPRFAQAHHRYSLFLAAVGRQEEGMEEARIALELDSVSAVMNAAVARHRYFSGDFDGALEWFERARRLDPGFFHPNLGVGVSYLALHRPEKAAAAFRKALEIAGGPHPMTVALLAVAQTQAGDPTAADRGLETLADLRAQGLFFVAPEYETLLHIARGDHDAALDALEAAFRNHSSAMAFLNVHPMVDPLRDEPRFQALVRRVGLPDGS